MERILSNQAPSHEGQRIKIAGWVAKRRDHGKLVFLDVRDRTGIVQVVCTPKHEEAYKVAERVRPEWVLEIEGTCQKRPEGMTADHPTGSVEIAVEKMTVLAEALTPPFPLDTTGYEIEEEKRLRHRYLDLRRERMKHNLVMRHRVIQFMREFLSKKEFIEIETPILTKSTPEGARDYVVPSRLYPGKFYALPQSPQQYKQLLQVAGFERYFQIARCFRDEDPRADRQPEFTQLDLEMSFVEQEDVIDLNEKLLIDIVQKLYPTKEIQEIPFPRITYKESMAKYKTDRPDLRKDKENANLLAFCWLVDFPFFEKDERGSWTFTHNPFSAPKPEHMADLIAKKNIASILTTQYDVVLNGSEIGGGSIRNHNPEALEKVFEIMGFETERIRKNFGHMLEALSFGAPPHGGIAWGFDRLMSLLQNEPSIREVMAFPKTGDAKDPMMGAPCEISPEQLKELHLKTGK
ncbi:MAG: aspartate--tRNA ligase [Parcubacteria group bacterium]|nr:aspartate--tRNA ligase [Parcubacteria group bacterium]